MQWHSFPLAQHLRTQGCLEITHQARRTVQPQRIIEADYAAA